MGVVFVCVAGGTLHVTLYLYIVCVNTAGFVAELHHAAAGRYTHTDTHTHTHTHTHTLAHSLTHTLLQNFNMLQFVAAMVSNIAFSLRAILGKLFMDNAKVISICT